MWTCVNVKEKHMEHLIENCFQLRLNDLQKGLLNPDKEIAGVVYKQKGLDSLRIEYKRIYKDRDFVLSLLVEKKNSSFRQDIVLDFSSIKFGLRPFFRCPLCLTNCNNLYLKLSSYAFTCRHHGLVYSLTRVNRASFGSELIYRHHHHMVIEKKKEKLKRVVYANKYTKNARSLLKLMAKWKIDEVAKDMIKANTKGLYR